MKTTKWVLMLAFAAVFVIGGVTGAALEMRHAQREMRPPFRSEMRGHFLQRMKAELDLTPDQVAKLTPIVDGIGVKLDSIHQETSAKVLQVFSDTDAQIARELTPQQQEKFKDMQKRREERLGGPGRGPDQGRGPGRGPGPGRGGF